MKKFWEGLYFITSAVGASIIACNINANVIGYCLFLIASTVGGVLAYNSNASRTIWMVNGIFGIINVVGIVRYMA